MAMGLLPYWVLRLCGRHIAQQGSTQQMHTPCAQSCVRARAADNKRDSRACKIHLQQTSRPTCQHPSWTAMPWLGPTQQVWLHCCCCRCAAERLVLDRICCQR
ncbi:unnamed protein product [Ectocarpus fasciculatus]